MFLDVGKRIKDARENRGMTMRHIAELIGVTEATFSRYESGHIGKVPLNRIEDIAKVLNCSPGYLMGWQEDPSPQRTPPDTTGQERTEEPRTLAAHREDGYDEDLPDEAKAELETILEYLKAKYKK